MTFQDLRLAKPLLQAVSDSGYDVPTPIQARSIPLVMEGRDLLGLAQTGTGKTAAFALPILHRLLEKPPQAIGGKRVAGARALVLSPTRELAQQVHQSFETYARYTNLRCVSVVGGVHQFSQAQALKAGVDVLIATPGRLIDLMQQRLARLTFVETVVLDEADRMLDIGFLPDIRRILAHVPEDRQTLMFSATMAPAISSLAQEALRSPERVQVAALSSAPAAVDHWVHFVEPAEKLNLLAGLLLDSPRERTIVFTRTKRAADNVARRLQRAGVRAAAMHGDKEQSMRTRTLEEFRAARLPVLVATDIAARGLHVDDVAKVINFDLTPEPETYVHRVGRTGRAGATGTAVSFCTPHERRELQAIERLIRQPLKRASGEPANMQGMNDAPAKRAPSRGRRSRGRRRPVAC